MKLAVMPLKPVWLEDRRNRLELVFGRKHRAGDEALQVGVLRDQAPEIAERVRDGVRRVLFLRKGEKGLGIAFRDTGCRDVGVVDFSHAEKPSQAI